MEGNLSDTGFTLFISTTSQFFHGLLRVFREAKQIFLSQNTFNAIYRALNLNIFCWAAGKYKVAFPNLNIHNSSSLPVFYLPQRKVTRGVIFPTEGRNPASHFTPFIVPWRKLEVGKCIQWLNKRGPNYVSPAPLAFVKQKLSK